MTKGLSLKARRSSKFGALVKHVEENVAWEHGTGSEWTCDCIIDFGLLSDLLRLASSAPAAHIKALLDV